MASASRGNSRAIRSDYEPMRDFVARQTLTGSHPSLVEHVFSEARARTAALGVELRLPRVEPRAHRGGETSALELLQYRPPCPPVPQ